MLGPVANRYFGKSMAKIILSGYHKEHQGRRKGTQRKISLLLDAIVDRVANKYMGRSKAKIILTGFHKEHQGRRKGHKESSYFAYCPC